MSWYAFPWVYPVWDSLYFLDLGDYFLSHVKGFFYYNPLKYFLISFLFLLFFWSPYNSNVGALNVIPEVLISFYSFFFLLLCFSFSTILFSSTLLHSSSSFILPLVPSKILLISVNVMFTADCLFFNSSMPLLNISCIFLIHASSLSVPPLYFLDFRSSLLSLLWILF